MKARVREFIGIIVEMNRQRYITGENDELEALYNIALYDEFKNVQYKLFDIPAHEIEIVKTWRIIE